MDDGPLTLLERVALRALVLSMFGIFVWGVATVVGFVKACWP